MYMCDYPHSMPVETSITAPSAILVLETIVETKSDDSRGGVPKTEPTEKLCLDLGAEMAFFEKTSPVISSYSVQGAPGVPGT